jgi:hypothetical protein
MPKRAAFIGTNYTKTLNRFEKVVLLKISTAPGINKLKSLDFRDSGSKRIRLQLLDASDRLSENLVEAWLYIGHMKRRLRICLDPQVTIQTVKQGLTKSLRRYGVEVEVRAS